MATVPSVQIGSLASSENGAFKIGPFGSSLKKSELVSEGIPIAGIENVLPNHFEKGFRRFITDKKFRELSDYEILPNDVLVTTMGTIGRAAVAPKNLGRTIIDSHLFRMRFDTSRVYPPYICHALNSGLVVDQLSRKARGAIMDGLNTSILKECVIPVPILPEQQRIAGLLVQADWLRRTRRYALELSDDFLSAAFRGLVGNLRANPFSFDLKPAGELFQIQLGKMLDAKKFTGKHLKPYLGNANVQWGRFDLSNLKKMDFPDDDFERFSLRPGDLLVCEGGEVGRTAIWNGEVSDCCYQKALHRLRRKTENVLPTFFLYFMKTAAESGLLAKHTATSTITHFTAEKFEDFPVVLPPLKLQKHFDQLVERHERLRATQREALRQAEHLFQTLLHRAFTVGI